MYSYEIGHLINPTDACVYRQANLGSQCVLDKIPNSTDFCQRVIMIRFDFCLKCFISAVYYIFVKM